MPFQALRFIHAADAFVDHQLEQTGPLCDDLRTIVEDAALTAFARVVSACIDRQVNFLLLAGNTFDERDCSLRARATLIDGFEKLQQHDIQVFVVAGEADPLAAWKAFGDLPQNVTLFSPTSDEPVAVLRDGNVIASIATAVFGDEQVGRIQVIGSPSQTSHSGTARAVPFSIGLATVQPEDMRASALDSHERQNAAGSSVNDPANQTCEALATAAADFLAIIGPSARQTITLQQGIAHNPGGTQGRRPICTGPHGCSLVEVAPDGAVACSFIPTAPVRWEQLAIHVDAGTSQDELVEQMQAALQRCRAEPTENVWLLNWTIRGSGPLFDALRDESFRSEITDLCELDVFPDHLSWTHQFRFVPVVNDLDSNLEENDFARQYFERLHHMEDSTHETLKQCLKDSGLPEGGWSNRLRSLIDEVDHEVIVAHARQHGMTWFAP